MAGKGGSLAFTATRPWQIGQLVGEGIVFGKYETAWTSALPFQVPVNNTLLVTGAATESGDSFFCMVNARLMVPAPITVLLSQPGCCRQWQGMAGALLCTAGTPRGGDIRYQPRLPQGCSFSDVYFAFTRC